MPHRGRAVRPVLLDRRHGRVRRVHVGPGHGHGGDGGRRGG